MQSKITGVEDGTIKLETFKTPLESLWGKYQESKKKYKDDLKAYKDELKVCKFAKLDDSDQDK